LGRDQGNHRRGIILVRQLSGEAASYQKHN